LAAKVQYLFEDAREMLKKRWIDLRYTENHREDTEFHRGIW